ncbi:hypothetical protein [Halobellus ruber]|uniref:Uncharacterized protein n=1 Tax=Halobellus ruber TaxID=2761102 RepID=A0A7J9SFD2_9EURY|nr:hypothetical protein [Halobellus ruber]MBB6644706.1 hypothetical protein [Halobellus ruber]
MRFVFRAAVPDGTGRYRAEAVVNRLRKDVDAAYADGRDAAGDTYALIDDLVAVLDSLTL